MRGISSVMAASWTVRWSYGPYFRPLRTQAYHTACSG